MANRMQDDDIAAALLEENVSEDDENYPSDSDHNSDHISEASESDSDTDMEDPEPVEETPPTLPFYTGKDGKTKWYKTPPRTNVRTSILTKKICLRLENSEPNPSTKETNREELKAVFGLLMLAGLYRSNRQSIIDLWANDGTGIEIFRNTMTRQRFTFLVNNLRFDDASTRTERAAIDRLTPIRDVFEVFVRNCQSAYTPFEYLTIDEELVAFRGRCSFRQYIPSKPAKYGLKLYALVDAKTFYTMNLEIYCGKQPDSSPYAVSNKPFNVVDRLVRCVSGSGRNITMDNFFMSFETVENLLQNHKLTAVGTLRSNKACLPTLFKARREEKSSMFGFQKDITIVSYIPKPRKCVHMMSSLHHDDEIDPESGTQRKPSIITFYDSTKSGVDVVDKLSRTYDVSRNSKR
ncbi:PiggyBac transposable element-derived protein 4 [Eumeta japonica]|uniref:PiggyBac transposable element-derived protein 4 n=1 Tax=Eumeta variegata TaxID=151549 RepID=A0A4C1Z677_EUMVA|nr:PiggyBac transposable element-derived protein 4 [Eumeta japonica]